MGSFLARLWTFILDAGPFLPAGCTPCKSCLSRPTLPSTPQSLPPNSLGSLQTQGCWFRVGGEHLTGLLWWAPAKPNSSGDHWD